MNSQAVISKMIEAFKNYEYAHQALLETWYNIIFLTPRWWIGLGLGIIPWFFWWKFHNKNYTGDLIRAGLFMAVIALVLDSIGVQLGLWIYPYDVFPFIPGYFPWDLTLLPITVMLLIEIMPNWSLVKKGIIYAGLTALAGEPLANFFQLYHPIHWYFFYSIPFYFVLYLLCDRIARSQKFNSRL